MELSEGQIHKFAELERCYSQYFYGSVVPVMEQVRKDINDKQLKELKDYSNSFAGMMSMAASNPIGGGSRASIDMIAQTGIWSRMNTEEYISMCHERIGKSEKITADLKLIADEWRNELVSTIGRERYDVMSEEMESDLSYAYAGFRMEQLMIDRLVRQNMPKSSLEYVMRMAAENSLLGLPAQLNMSPLDRAIAVAGEKAYEPSIMEKGAGRVLGFGMDTVVTGGFSSWASLGKLALFEAGIEGVGAIYDINRKKGEEEPNVEELISRGVFGSESNIVDTFCRESKRIDPHENEYIRGLNDKMQGRMRLIPEENLAWMKKCSWQPEFKLDLQQMMKNETADTSVTLLSDNKEEQEAKNARPDIPSVVLPGKEEGYLSLQQEQKMQVGTADEDTREGDRMVPSNEKTLVDEQKVETSSGQNGWGSLLSSIGLSDVGSVGRNIGYVISMLPDLLVGLFTGKTKSLKLMDNLFPIASILMGLFSKNPLVRMLLVGLGGMNLINKAGHESLDKKATADQNTTAMHKREYKAYADEPLNSRVVNPEIKGEYLLAMIDQVPCSIHLPDVAVAAFRAGALPLNTLVNAVLVKNDELRTMAQENYEATESRNVKSRGIG